MIIGWKPKDPQCYRSRGDPDQRTVCRVRPEGLAPRAIDRAVQSRPAVILEALD